MKHETEDNNWEPARLIPVSGIRNAEEQECRGTSALLAVLKAVEEFGFSLTKPYGAIKGNVETFIEVPFTLEEERIVRPDGLIRVTRGKKSWVALVEVKTGNSPLKQEQIEDYLDVAKDNGFDCVITVSNQIAMIPGEHPVSVNKRKLNKVSLHHMSWSRILTEAVLQKTQRGVADPDQAWILDELIRYLEHPNAGAVDFCDMGEHWVGVRDAAKNGTLRHSDNKATEIAGKWEQLVTYTALRLGRKLGAEVKQILTAKERADLGVRINTIVDKLVTNSELEGTIRIPNTIGDISIKADIRAQQVIVSIQVKAPQTGRPLTRINWLLRQLKNAPANTKLESWGARSRTSMSDLLSSVHEKPTLLEPADKKEIVSFTISAVRPMGIKKGTGPKSFIDSILGAVDDFYGDVVQGLSVWQAPAPKLSKEQEPKKEPSTENSNPMLPAPQTIPCPHCKNPLDVAKLKHGINTCTHCEGNFEVE